MARFQSAVAAGCVTFVLLAVTACGADPAPKPQADPTNASPSPAPSTRTSPSPTLPASQSKYTADQLAQYKRAEAALAHYVAVDDAVFRRGVFNARARRQLSALTRTKVFVPESQRLFGYDSNGLRQAGKTVLIGTRPTRITASSVSLRACLDLAHVGVLDKQNRPVKGLL